MSLLPGGNKGRDGNPWAPVPRGELVVENGGVSSNGCEHEDGGVSEPEGEGDLTGAEADEVSEPEEGGAFVVSAHGR